MTLLSERRWLILGSSTLDSLGTGAFYPLVLVYLTRGGGLSTSEAGVLLSIGALVAIPFTFFAGRLLYRIGAGELMILSSVFQMAGLFLMLHDNVYVLTSGSFLVSAGLGLYYPASGTMARAIASLRLREWYGLDRALRTGAVGLGAAIGGALLTAFGSQGLRYGLIGDIVSFAGAAGLIAILLGTPEWRGVGKVNSSKQRMWFPRSTGYVSFCAANTFMAVAILSLSYVVPVYLLDVPGLPVWLPSALIVGNTVLVFALQAPVSAWGTRFSAMRTCSVAALPFAVAFGVLGVLSLVSGGLAFTMAIVFILLFTAGELFFSPAAAAFPAEVSKPSELPSYQSLYQGSWAVATVIAPGVVALGLGHLGYGIWILCGVCCLGCSVCFRALSGFEHSARDRSVTVNV